jgi:hypothetical protein
MVVKGFTVSEHQTSSGNHKLTIGKPKLELKISAQTHLVKWKVTKHRIERLKSIRSHSKNWSELVVLGITNKLSLKRKIRISASLIIACIQKKARTETKEVIYHSSCFFFFVQVMIMQYA